MLFILMQCEDRACRREGQWSSSSSISWSESLKLSLKSGSCGCCSTECAPITPNCERFGSSSLEGSGDSSSSARAPSSARRPSASPSSVQNMLRTFVRFSCSTTSSAAATRQSGMNAQTSSPLRRQSPSLPSKPPPHPFLASPSSPSPPCRQSNNSFLSSQSPQRTKFWLTKWEMAKLRRRHSRTVLSPSGVRMATCRRGILYSWALQMAAWRSWLLLRMASDSWRNWEWRVRFCWKVMVVSRCLSSIESRKASSLRAQVSSECDSFRLGETEGYTFPGTRQCSVRKSCSTSIPVEFVNCSARPDSIRLIQLLFVLCYIQSMPHFTRK